MRMKPPNKHGFTLIEIMLALLVVTVGIVAITGVLGTALDTSAKSHDDLHVVGFADMVLNHYHAATNWSEIPPEGSLEVPDYNAGTLNLQLDALQRFTCTVPGFGGTDKETYTVGYVLHAEQPARNVKTLSLQVWPGYSTNAAPRTFYTEFYNWADQ